MREWFTAKELAGLPGMPSTERRVRSKAERENWQSRKRPKGKGREYHLSSLPQETRQHLRSHQLVELAQTCRLPGPEPIDPMAKANWAADGLLTDRQRRERDARLAVLAAVERMQRSAHCSREDAMRTLLTTARAGTAPVDVIEALKLARDPRGRKGSDPFPSMRTLKRWLAKGDLAPRAPAKDMTVPAWAEVFMRCWQRPEKPSVEAAYRQACQIWTEDERPSIHQVRRFLRKLGAVAREGGRMGPRELKNIRPFVRRGFEELEPNDIWSADGHTFDAEVQHPFHGRPFRPEITTIVDIRTRRVVGWSVALAESAQAVADALRYGVEREGAPVWWYVDNGSGYKNRMIAGESLGICHRLAIQVTYSLPYNSQARGVIERLHQTLWVPAARDLPGYVGRDMDREARLEHFRISRQALKSGGALAVVPWDVFLRYCAEKVAEYNARPHKALDGLSPDQVLAQYRDNGWRPRTVSAEALDTLFRPRVVRAIRRGEIQLFSNIYFARELEEFHGMEAQVAYDIHDPNQVWVFDDQGRFLCRAQWNGNRRT